MIKILNIDGNIIYESNTSTLKEAVEEAAKNKVSLYKANLKEADLYQTDLYGVDLREANLYKADLYKADLRGANLKGANLIGAKGIRIFTAGVSNRLCYTYVYNNEQRWNLGCFDRNYEETKKAVKAKYGKDSYYYKMIKTTRGSIETQ
jgi:uncharacterized protein YjbI with pentapeptide repeats